MPTTIRDLLDEPALGLELLVDGDLDREIRWVHVTELADASPYLVGDEFVLTAGVWRGRRHSAEGFVRALHSRDVAGIGYGLLVGDDGVPAAVRKACKEAGVPLLVVPLSTPFVAISQWFVDRLAADREQALRETLRLTADLLVAAEQPSADSALSSVARLLRRSTGHDVWIADDAGHLLARAGAAPDSPTRQRAALAAAHGRTEIDGWVVQPVGSGRTPAAVIAVAVDDTDDLQVRSRIDAARPVVGLVLARERAVKESERRLAGEVVSLVLGRQVESAAARMPYYGLDPDGSLLPFVCAVADREHALDSAERWLEDTDVSGVVALRGDELMLVVDGRPFRDSAGAVAAASALAQRVGAIAVGTGSVADDVSGLRRSLVQARQACELGRRRGGGAVVSHDLTGSHTLLLALQDQDVLDAFRESLLAPMEDYDAQHGSSLVATLRTFLDTGGRWQETADLLHVHVNTLRNRLERVESLTGRRLDSTPDRVDLWLALQAPSAGTPAPEA
ncbi:MAG: helix-turn-helix domain-containing protein [Actinomycetales bacterium]|nr:helix-turn-helix domain-containing protein [Actinomycetales bacterium]